MRARDLITQHSHYVPSIVNRDPCKVDVRQILNYYQEIGNELKSPNTNIQHHLSEQPFHDELSFLFGYIWLYGLKFSEGNFNTHT